MWFRAAVPSKNDRQTTSKRSTVCRSAREAPAKVHPISSMQEVACSISPKRRVRHRPQPSGEAIEQKLSHTKLIQASMPCLEEQENLQVEQGPMACFEPKACQKSLKSTTQTRDSVDQELTKRATKSSTRGEGPSSLPDVWPAVDPKKKARTTRKVSLEKQAASKCSRCRMALVPARSQEQSKSKFVKFWIGLLGESKEPRDCKQCLKQFCEKCCDQKWYAPGHRDTKVWVCRGCLGGIVMNKVYRQYVMPNSIFNADFLPDKAEQRKHRVRN